MEAAEQRKPNAVVAALGDTPEMPIDQLLEHRAELAFRAFLDCLPVDRTDPHLQDTPRRVAAMYFREMLNPEEFNFTTFPTEADSMVLIRDVPFSSICAHHFLPFVGVAHLGYIPDERMVGLSKLARAVDYFARRPQVQERLTEQIAFFIQDRLLPKAVGVVLEAEHHCMTVRGVSKPGARTVTSSMLGNLREDERARAEFMSLVTGGG